MTPKMTKLSNIKFPKCKNVTNTLKFDLWILKLLFLILFTIIGPFVYSMNEKDYKT